MKRLDSKGFTIIEGLIILVVVSLIGFISWWVYQDVSKSDSSPNQDTEVTQKQSDFNYSDAIIPTSWRVYTNETYKFSFKYPDDKFKPYENRYTSQQVEDSYDSAVFAGGVSSIKGQGGYEVRVLTKSIEDAISKDQVVVNDSLYKDSLKQETIYKNGLKGIRLSYKYDNNNVSYFFIQGNNGFTYRFSAVEETGVNKEESEAIYNSLTFNL